MFIFVLYELFSPIILLFRKGFLSFWLDLVCYSKSKLSEFPVYFFFFGSSGAYRIRKLIAYIVVSTIRFKFFILICFQSAFISVFDLDFQAVFSPWWEVYFYFLIVSGGFDLMMKVHMKLQKSQFPVNSSFGHDEKDTSN